MCFYVICLTNYQARGFINTSYYLFSVPILYSEEENLLHSKRMFIIQIKFEPDDNLRIHT